MLIEQLKAIVGPKGWTTDEHDLEPLVTEWRGVHRGRTQIALYPSSTSEVADIVRACGDAGVSVVPQGGNTGMCAGAVPDASGNQVLLCLSRMNRIRLVDPADFSLVAEAGCVLADIQKAAKEVERYFPLSLGGEGSCQIGGNLSTNAGGINVIRYGTARDLVLGVEVVLANGRVWDGIKTLRKDTAGYDLKQLFIGSEGTLGIITAAAVKLFPDPGETTTALLSVGSAESAVALLGYLRSELGDSIQAFELIGATAFELVQRYVPNTDSPFDSASPWYVLLETAIGPSEGQLERVLESAMQRGHLADGVVAKNKAEAQRFWRLRHSISEAEKRIGKGLKHDISVPIGQMQRFIETGAERLRESFPESTLIVFGHVGDGNLHYNIVLPDSSDEADTAARRDAASRLVYDLVEELNGSISAEHGIGLLKRGWLDAYKGDTELELMRTLKRALDPAKTLNPGKVI